MCFKYIKSYIYIVNNGASGLQVTIRNPIDGFQKFRACGASLRICVFQDLVGNKPPLRHQKNPCVKIFDRNGFSSEIQQSMGSNPSANSNVSLLFYFEEEVLSQFVHWEKLNEIQNLYFTTNKINQINRARQVREAWVVEIII